MAGDVTIPAETARDIAAYLRGRAPGLPSFGAGWVDLLDPRPVSLREACVNAMHDVEPDADRAVVDAVLAVVKARIEALPTRAMTPMLLRDDVLALFGDES
jgi:hypothetical protein